MLRGKRFVAYLIVSYFTVDDGKEQFRKVRRVISFPFKTGQVIGLENTNTDVCQESYGKYISLSVFFLHLYISRTKRGLDDEPRFR